MPTLSILTFNCLGVPVPGMTRRLRLLGDVLNRESFAAVCLQEVQTHLARRLLTTASHHYPEQVYEPFVHAPKGGLLTLSRLLVARREFILYRERGLRGLWYTPAVTDWLLHKGILATYLRLDDLPIVLLNTHLTANYSGDWSRTNPYAQHEHSQLQQLAEVVQLQPPDALVLVCGDFNVPRGCWIYEAFMEASGLRDPRDGQMQPTLRPPRLLPDRYAVPLDFALVRAPVLPGLTLNSRLRFQERVPHNGRHFHLSDHSAVELTLTWAGV